MRSRTRRYRARSDSRSSSPPLVRDGRGRSSAVIRRAIRNRPRPTRRYGLGAIHSTTEIIVFPLAVSSRLLGATSPRMTHGSDSDPCARVGWLVEDTTRPETACSPDYVRAKPKVLDQGIPTPGLLEIRRMAGACRSRSTSRAGHPAPRLRRSTRAGRSRRRCPTMNSVGSVELRRAASSVKVTSPRLCSIADWSASGSRRSPPICR